MSGIDPDEFVRVTLSAALARLGKGKGATARYGQAHDQGNSAEASQPFPGIVILIVPVQQNDLTKGNGDGNAGLTSMENLDRHPSEERFTLGETQTPGKAPIRCFIEPARECIGSGACESRGF